jgi:CheY-like chemotaxis protein
MVMQQGESRRAVVAEDDHLVGTLIAALLGKLGYAVVGRASTGMRAVELVEATRPDVVLMDIGLPDMSGYEVLAALRRQDQTRETPIIGISSDATPADIEKGLRAGFQNYLTKPFMLQEFRNAIDQMLPKSKLN